MSTFRHSFNSATQIARYFSKVAIGALYDELSLFPKPGLVSFVDSGAHKDMDGVLFYRSLFGLRHYFYKVALNAANGMPPNALVPFGIAAEGRMNAITNNINTHRGAIFALGILCSSIARLSGQRKFFSTHDLQNTIIMDWGFYLKHLHQNDNTHGALIKKKYKVEDATYLAINGYATVFNIFHNIVDMQLDNKVFLGLIAYKQLLIFLDDINILYRTGRIGLAFARQAIDKAIILSAPEQSIFNAIQLHQIFSQKNISPGGVADMLGFIYFLLRVFNPD